MLHDKNYFLKFFKTYIIVDLKEYLYIFNIIVNFNKQMKKVHLKMEFLVFACFFLQVFVKADILQNPSYHPSDFLHGILAAHCYEEDLQEGDHVSKTTQTWTPSDFFKSNDALLNKTLSDWRVLQVVDLRDDSGYVGVIYVNDWNMQLVLAHRGTKVLASYFEDAIGVFGGQVTPFQRDLRIITQNAIDLIKNDYPDYALSFAGHSLGGWLADLSLYYSHQIFNFR